MADLTGKKRKKITVLLDFFPDEVILLIIPIVFQSTSAGSATYFVSSALLHLIYSLVLLISNTVVLTAFCALSRCLQRPWDVTPEGEELLRSRKLHRNLRYNIHFYLKQLSASISWNAIPWAGCAFLDFVVQGKSITAECFSCQPH